MSTPKRHLSTNDHITSLICTCDGHHLQPWRGIYWRGFLLGKMWNWLRCGCCFRFHSSLNEDRVIRPSCISFHLISLDRYPVIITLMANQVANWIEKMIMLLNSWSTQWENCQRLLWFDRSSNKNNNINELDLLHSFEQRLLWLYWRKGENVVQHHQVSLCISEVI